MADVRTLTDESSPLESPPGRVSVIIVTHNRARLLPRALQSVRTAGSVCQIVVVDNASTDETRAVCQSTAGIEYVRIDRRQTLGGARNVGLVASRGEYVTFLDDDDVRLPESITTQLEVLNQKPDAAFVYGQAMIGEPDGQPGRHSYPNECTDGDIFWRLAERNFVPSGSVIYRRSCFAAVGLFDDHSGDPDWDFCVRLAEVYPVAALKVPVMVWRRSAPDSGQMTSDAAKMTSVAVGQFREWMKLPRALSGGVEVSRQVRKNFSENMCEHLIVDTGRALRRQLLGRVFKNLLVLLKLEAFAIPRVAIKRTPRLLAALRGTFGQQTPSRSR